MRDFVKRAKEMRKAVAAVMLCSIFLASTLMIGCGTKAAAPDSGQRVGYYPGTLTSQLPNYPFTMAFTATSQTVTQNFGGYSSCLIEYTAATATTVTWSFKGSMDGGTTYYALGVAPYVAGTLVPTATAVTNSNATSALYVVNVANMTQGEIVTSGTFTATGVKFFISCSSNPGLVTNIG